MPFAFDFSTHSTTVTQGEELLLVGLVREREHHRLYVKGPLACYSMDAYV